jgi:hypothetical protein
MPGYGSGGRMQGANAGKMKPMGSGGKKKRNRGEGMKAKKGK